MPEILKIKNLLKIVFTLSLILTIVSPLRVSAQMGDVGGNPSPDEYDYSQGQVTAPSAVACTSSNLGERLICQVYRLISLIAPVLLALGVVYFVWGVVQYMIGSDEEAKKRGRNRIVYGIIGLAVIGGLWGLVNIVVSTFGLGGANTIVNPSSVLVTDNSGPSVASAFCSIGSNPQFQNLVGYATCIINKSIIPLIFALALAMFVWGVINFLILGAGEEAKREQGRQFMIWGIVALAVMVSVWGLVHILGNTFSIEYAIPQVKSR